MGTLCVMKQCTSFIICWYFCFKILGHHHGDESHFCVTVSLSIMAAFAVSVNQESELAHKNQATTSIHRAGDSEVRSLELGFLNNIKSLLLTGDQIKGVGGVPIKVTLVDSCTKEQVKSGPEASGRVKIRVLEVEDERNESQNILVIQTEGNKSRVSDICLNLKEGTTFLPEVSFTHNSRWMRISKFRLEARFIDNFNGVQVKEAKTEPFILKDRRLAAYEKHTFPSLRDDTWRLNEIGRKGRLASSLRTAKIRTVEDFIVCQFLQPQILKEIFNLAKSAKRLEPAVKHARTCPAKLVYRSSFEPKSEVAFNVSGEVLGLFLDGKFVSIVTLSETQKEEPERRKKESSTSCSKAFFCLHN